MWGPNWKLAVTSATFTIAVIGVAPAQADVISSLSDSNVLSLGGNQNGAITGNVPAGGDGALRLEQGATLIADALELNPKVAPSGFDDTMSWTFRISGPSNASPELTNLSITETFGSPGTAPSDQLGPTNGSLSGSLATNSFSDATNEQTIFNATSATQDYDITDFEMIPGLQGSSNEMFIDSFEVTYDEDSNGNNVQQVASVNFQSVPVPSSIGLLGAGLLGLGLVVRRRHNA